MGLVCVVTTNFHEGLFLGNTESSRHPQHTRSPKVQCMKELSKFREGLESAVEPGNAWLVNAVFDLLEWRVKRCDRLEKENERLRERIAQLESGDDPPPPAESYSLDAEDRRRQRKHRKKKLASKRKPGRRTNWTAFAGSTCCRQASPSGSAAFVVAELLRLMTAEQLFGHPPNKTDTGATRQSRIVSVLESLRRTLNSFTLKSVVDHIVEPLQGERLFHGTGPPPQEPGSSSRLTPHG